MISWYVQGIYYNIYANLQQASDASLCTTMTDKDDLEGQCFRDSVYLYLTIILLLQLYPTDIFFLVFDDACKFKKESTVRQNDIAVS